MPCRVPEQVMPEKDITRLSPCFDRGLPVKFFELLVIHSVPLLPLEIGENLIDRPMGARPHREAAPTRRYSRDQPRNPVCLY